MPTTTIKFQQTFVGIKSAPTINFNSSRGLLASYHGVLKPDIMALGSNVLADYVPTKPVATIGTNVTYPVSTSCVLEHLWLVLMLLVLLLF